MTHLLSTLREVTPDRHNRAVQGLRDHTLTVTLVKQTDAEIRALVRNGDAKEYRIIINDTGSLCSCPDAFYHRGPCKHVAAVCVTALQPKADNSIHLQWDSGVILCGESNPRRYWQRWTLNALSWPDVCPQCVHTWTHPAEGGHHA
jgi:predicted nucleic acid-binding Zn finger protein